MTEHRHYTPGMRRALEILRDHGPLTPANFAKRYYPKDDPGWKRQAKCGYGSHAGSGLVMGAGGFLGKLRHMGLAEAVDEYGQLRQTRITAAGKAWLKEAQAHEREARTGSGA